MRKNILWMLALLFVFGCGMAEVGNDEVGTDEVGTDEIGETAKMLVVGYVPSWRMPYNPRWDKVTHLNIAFGTVNADGTLDVSVLDSFTNLIEEAHRQKVKVLLSVGGGVTHSFTEVILKPEKRNVLVSALAKCTNDYGIDGIDLDYEEWEGGPGGAGSTDAPKREALELLYKELRAKLGNNKLITAAVSGSWDNGGWGFYNCYNNTMFAYLDFVNVMIYDETGPWAGSSVGSHSSWTFFTNAINHWLKNRNLPKEKLVAGVPFYGYTFLSPNSAAGATAVAYRDILASDGEAWLKDQVGLTYYDGTVTMKKKAQYIRDNGIGGIMIWELAQDTDDPEKSLLTAIGS